MFTQALGIADDPVATFFYLMATGYGFFLIVATLHYLLLFRRHKHTTEPGEIRRGLLLSLASMAGNALVTAPIHVAIALGYSKVYFDVGEMGWIHLVLSIACMFVFTETLVYWAHRILHMGPLYRKLHRHHHGFVETNPYMAVAFHPLDSLLQALPHHLFAFVFPVHIGVYMASVALVAAWSVVIHDRVSIVKWGGINYTAHHDIHHWYYDFNYGQYTTFWDRLCGTYRKPAELWPPKETAAEARRKYDPLVNEPEPCAPDASITAPFPTWA